MTEQELRAALNAPQKRSFEIRAEDLDKESRTIELSFSSEMPVSRWGYIEILSHEPGHIRLERLKRGGALLVEHDPKDHVGVVSEIRVDTGARKLRAKGRFGKSARAEEVFQDVVDEIKTNVSVRYQVYRWEEVDSKTMSTELAQMAAAEGVKVFRAVDWEPAEVSIVSIPADVSVGVGRNHEPLTNNNSHLGERAMGNETKPPAQGSEAVDVEQIRVKADKDARERVSEIYALTDKFASKVPSINELRELAMAKNWPVDQYRKELLEKMATSRAIDTKADDDRSADLGLSDKEVQQYSILRAIRGVADGKFDGLEREASEALSKKIGRTAKGFFLAPEAMRAGFGGSLPADLANILSRHGISAQRDLSAGVANKGGFLVGTDVLVGSMIELLRNRPKLAQLGVRTLSGLVGNVAIPKVSGGATAYWLPEDGSVNKSDQAFGQLGLVPHRLVGDTAYSKELINQTSLDVEAFVREDLMTVLAIEKDRVGITGVGAAGEPLGIMNTTGLATAVTFGGAPTWAKVVEFETNVADNNADVATQAYLTTPAVRGKWKTTVKVSNTAEFLWEKDGSVNGYRAEITKQVPGNKVIHGNFADAIFADWAGIDVVVDPYSLKKSGQIEITITLWTDFGVRHPVSFCVSADSGAQ